MPKIVDADARRQEIARALFQVVVRDGIRAVSLRTVAEQAGLSIGSVRHYLRDHGELMVFAQRAVIDTVAERVRTHVAALSPAARTSRGRRREAVVDLLAELLPLDEQRRREAIVWLEFTIAARTDPAIAAHVHESAAALRAAVRQVLEGAAASAAATAIDLDLEVQRLAALIDGLTLTLVTAPDQLTPEDARAALRRELDLFVAG